MLNVSFRDNSEAIKELLIRKVQAATEAAARVLAKEYKKAMDTRSPKHSPAGTIPNKYLGWRPEGYGPVNEGRILNNTTLQGFSSDQDNYLKEYIQAARSNNGAVVGFEPSHVTTRQKNYLLGWDQGTIPNQPGVFRPWVDEVYLVSKGYIKQEAATAFREAQ